MNPTMSPKKRSLASLTISPSKKLKRLPHVFAQVLELPFHSDADVSVHESPNSFRFLAGTAIADRFRAHIIKISLGITKIQVRGLDDDDDDDDVDSLIQESDDDIYTWRVRLPSTALPEMTMAECIGGQLVVTVPKLINLDCRDDNLESI